MAATTRAPDPLAGDRVWRRLDSRMLLVHPVNELLRFLPAVVGVFVVGESSGDGGVWWHVLAVGVPIALGLLRFVTTSFRVSDGQLELRRGLLNRTVLTAPLDRIRAVDLTASPIHRLLGLAKVEIGTGSATRGHGERLQLDSLGIGEARTFRTALLHRTPAAEVDAGTAAHDEVLLRLDPAWIRYAPFTTSGLLIAFAAVGATSQFSGPLIGRLAHGTHLGRTAQAVPLWGALLVALLAFLVVISVFAVLGYVLTNWGFTLTRDPGSRSLHVVRGLLTSRESSIETARLRGVEVHQPLGLRLAGGARLVGIVTGRQRRDSGSTPLVPPAPAGVVDGVGSLVLGDPVPFRMPLRHHGRAATRRRYVRALGTTVPATAVWTVVVVALRWDPALLLLDVLAVAGAWLLARDRGARLGHGLTDHYLVLQAHTFGGRRDVLLREGIIGWGFQQSWFQRRAGLVTLVATTSAGKQGYRVYDVPEPVAVALARIAVPGLLDPFLA
ncbi:MAG: PH domain-containing protein [Marmoricola sp.]